jgi:hypothetical protein
MEPIRGPFEGANTAIATSDSLEFVLRHLRRLPLDQGIGEGFQARGVFLGGSRCFALYLARCKRGGWNSEKAISMVL